MKPILAEQDFIDAADHLGILHPATLKAVAEVETSGFGFLVDGSLRILFEGHIFWKYTKDRLRFSKSDPDICYPHWDPKKYARAASEDQRGRLEIIRLRRATALDPAAAVLSASYGKFQIMGFNFALCGYTSAEAMVADFEKGEGEQLLGFCEYLTHAGLTEYLRNKDWDKFARRYNGPLYQKNNYAEKLAAAYKKFSSI